MILKGGRDVILVVFVKLKTGGNNSESHKLKITIYNSKLIIYNKKF